MSQVIEARKWSGPGPCVGRGTASRALPPRAFRGFTLIELMVVIAIIIMAAGLMTPTITDFFRNRQLDGIRGLFGAAFNSARLEAVTKGVRVSMVFFREGVRVYSERQKRFVDELFNPDASQLSNDTVWYKMGFLGGKSNWSLPRYYQWEDRQLAQQGADKTRGKRAAAGTQFSVTGLPKITFERDGSLTFESGSNVASSFFKDKSNADIIIEQAGNNTVCLIDYRDTGQIRCDMVPKAEPVSRPEDGIEDDGSAG